jgi:serine/threonine-protein phosphatase 2A regulatory subunit A
MAYPRLNAELQAELRQIYQTLAGDDMPMVRKAAFVATGPLATVLKKEHVKEVVLPALKTLAEDGADSTRVHFVECVLAIAPVFVGSADEFAECVLPVFEAVAEDASWRVRAKFAKQMDKLVEVLPQPLSAQHALPVFAALLRDNEAEVRAGAVAALLGVCRASQADAFKAQVLPLIAGGALDADASAPVRVALSEAIADLCPVLGKDAAQNTILPVVLRMLKDDEADVRLNIISKIDVLSQILGAEQLSATIAPAVIEMAQDAKWRVRLSVMEKLAHIGKQLGAAFFEKALRDLFLAGLADSVYAVRTAAAEQIRPIIGVFGVDWATKKLLPQIFEIYEKAVNYLHRMVPVVLVGHLAGVVPGDVCAEAAVPLVLKACKDPVSNVRLSAARALEKLIPMLDAVLIQTRVKPVLVEMKSDADSDVQYYAGQALKKC